MYSAKLSIRVKTEACFSQWIRLSKDSCEILGACEY